ncbi:hypothetical protein D3C76_1039950 [compost metagenome]
MLVHEEVPVQLGDIAHVEEMVAAALLVLELAGLRARQLGLQCFQALDLGQRLTDPRAHGAAVRAGQDDAAGAVDEVDAAVIAALVLVYQLDHRVHRQADARGTEELAVVIEHLVVDEDGQSILVGQVDIDIDLVRVLQVAHAEVPDVPWLVAADLLEHALGLVVGEGAVGDEEAGEGPVVLLYLAQVAGHLVDVLLPLHHPVADEGVTTHHRGDQDRPHQVLLDLRVDIVRGQRQFGVDDAGANGLERSLVADQRGGQEAAAKQQYQREDQQAVALLGVFF